MCKVRQIKGSSWNAGIQTSIRTIVNDFGEEAEYKLCPKCTRYHPATTDYFYTITGKSGVRLLSSYCKRCQCKLNKDRIRADENYYTRRWQAIQADPARAEAAREYSRLHAAKERVEKPDQYRARLKRHYDKVMADPVRHARYREGERLRRHLQREREGKPIVRKGHVKYKITEPDVRVPVEPFVELLNQMLATHGSRNDAARRCGISDSLFGDIARGDLETVTLDTADKICTTLGLPLNSYLPDELAA